MSHYINGQKTVFVTYPNSSAESPGRIIFVSFLVFYYYYHKRLFISPLGSRLKTN